MPDVILTNFQPRRRLISSVTNALQAIVTTTENHGYILDQVVRLIVPSDYGMEIDYVKGKIVSIPADNQFKVNIDTTRLFPYATPTEPPAFTQAHVVPITGLVDNETSITG